ncbi:MAG: ABC-2 transporter permease [Oscillospiraceae bacterium]|nr:ABC-2 transporter permease [Oscillospiraceae bacterium]
MKGLLKKDLYMAWAYSKIVLIMLAVFLGVSFFSGDSLFLMLYPVVICAMLPVTLLSYDERFRWNIYCDTLPMPRSVQVTEKYLLTLIFGAVVFFLLALAHGIRLLPAGRTDDFLVLLSMMVLFALVSPGLILPFMFKMGPEKGRLAYFLMFGLLLVVVILLTGRTVEDLPQVSGGVGMLLGTLVFGILVFVGSWRLAIRWYDKREF